MTEGRRKTVSFQPGSPGCDSPAGLWCKQLFLNLAALGGGAIPTQYNQEDVSLCRLGLEGLF